MVVQLKCIGGFVEITFGGETYFGGVVGRGTCKYSHGGQATVDDSDGFKPDFGTCKKKEGSQRGINPAFHGVFPHFQHSTPWRHLLTQRTQVAPVHGLMPVRFSGAGHVFSGESSADDGVIVMFHSSATEFDVVEARGVAGHPNVGPRLQLGVDHESTQMLIHFQTCESGPNVLSLSILSLISVIAVFIDIIIDIVVIIDIIIVVISIDIIIVISIDIIIVSNININTDTITDINTINTVINTDINIVVIIDIVIVVMLLCFLLLLLLFCF